MIETIANVLICVAGYILGFAALIEFFQPEGGGWGIVFFWTLFWIGICIKWVF